MRSGLEHFNNDFKSMLKSFVWVFAGLVLSLSVFPLLYDAKVELHDTPMYQAMLIFCFKFVLNISLGFLFVYYVCKILKKLDQFIKFVTAVNWLSVVNIVLFLPLLALMYLGVSEFSGLYSAIITISVYGYVLSAFLVRYVMEIPWELAIFIAICGLAINEASQRLFYYLVA